MEWNWSSFLSIFHVCFSRRNSFKTPLNSPTFATEIPHDSEKNSFNWKIKKFTPNKTKQTKLAKESIKNWKIPRFHLKLLTLFHSYGHRLCFGNAFEGIKKLLHNLSIIENRKLFPKPLRKQLTIKREESPERSYRSPFFAMFNIVYQLQKGLIALYKGNHYHLRSAKNVL